MLSAAAIILAGGKSTRMGSNKALLKVTEKRMLESAVNALSGMFPEIFISVNDRVYDELQVRHISDIFPGRGPLGGIHAGLAASSYEVNFFTACDMPFIDARLAGFMVELIPGYDAVVPKIDDYYQPLFAVYTKNCLKSVEQQLSGGRNKITSFYDEIKIRFVGEEELCRFGNPDEMFFNVNTPSDLDKAKVMVRRAQHGSEV